MVIGKMVMIRLEKGQNPSLICVKLLGIAIKFQVLSPNFELNSN